MNSNAIDFAQKDSVAVITIEKLNNDLLNKDVIKKLIELLHRIEGITDCKSIVIRNISRRSGRTEMLNPLVKVPVDIDVFREWEKVIRFFEKIGKVTMAVIEGECFGAGMQLALACDIRIAANDARFAHDEVKMGILPGVTILQLGKFCGLGRMLELVQTGREYTAKEAAEWGVICEICDPLDIDAMIMKALQNYSVSDLNIHKLIRRLAKESFEMSYEEFIGCFLAAQHRVISDLDFMSECGFVKE